MRTAQLQFWIQALILLVGLGWLGGQGLFDALSIAIRARRRTPTPPPSVIPHICPRTCGSTSTYHTYRNWHHGWRTSHRPGKDQHE